MSLAKIRFLKIGVDEYRPCEVAVFKAQPQQLAIFKFYIPFVIYYNCFLFADSDLANKMAPPLYRK